jgi:hypothetical protein
MASHKLTFLFLGTRQSFASKFELLVAAEACQSVPQQKPLVLRTSPRFNKGRPPIRFGNNSVPYKNVNSRTT